ncbi:MAG: hypothetical protein KDA77_00060 [Planctomycetaceae bacterium]|nr:hypothetical protein [Planctomycetaceae bacterium]
MQFRGGLQITAFAWLDSHSLRVRFATTYTDKLYQLYAGRSLIGRTEAAADTYVIGTLQPSLWPEHIQLLAVDPNEIENEYGSLLPDRPYNRALISVTTAGWTDAKYLDVVSGQIPGGAVDSANRIHRELFDENREYSILTPTFHGSGTWNLQVFGRDDKPLEGNAGTAIALTAKVLSHPPDVQIRSDGSRLAASVAGGVATVDFNEAIE